MKKALGLFLLLISSLWAFSQSYKISGVVLDSTNSQPLPFVNILVNDKPIGTTSDIDGRFTIQSNEAITSLTFSYVGYNKLKLEGSSLREKPLAVYLSSEGVEMRDVVVLPGENPAHRIVENTTANRKKNNPEQLPSFSYTSYNKMYFTADKPENLVAKDSSDTRLIDFFEKRHLFLSETVSERIFKSGKNNEKVLATRVSGLKDPTFSVMATEFQSFSFYNDYFTLGDKNYLNPISKGSTDKYFFLLEDTIYSGADSIFVISYRPKKGKNFDGLEGLIYITTDGWAVQNVTASAVDADNVSLNIQQKYEKIEGHWFPVQLNTDMVLNVVNVNNFHVKGIGRAYLRDIQINPELKNNQFSQVELEIMPDASTKSDDFWNQYRLNNSLSEKEKNTYHFIDSVGKEANLDRKVKVFTALSTGKYPIGPVDIDLRRILSVNDYEAVRLGAGAHTNDKLSRVFVLGGWWGYGFKDKAAKYGGDIQLNLHRNSELALKTEYQKEIPEAGRSELMLDRKPTTQELYRKYYLGRRDKLQEWRFSIQWRMLKYLKVQAGLAEQAVSITDNYLFGAFAEGTFVGVNQFHFTEAFVGLRYAFREKIIRTKEADYSSGTKYPVLWVTASKGLTDVWNGAYEYLKVDGKIEYKFIIRNLGTQTWQVTGGWVSDDVPYSKLYKGRGNYQEKLPAASENAFETMGINEFIANKYVTLYHTHNFGTLLLRTKRLEPSFVLVNNVCFGWLNKPSLHHNVPVRSFEHGFFETGLRIDNILKLNFSGFGAGVYYRYGGYQNPELKDNIAAKLTLTFVL